MTIPATPKRSVSLPKQGDQKVLHRGIDALPPLASAAKALQAAASSGNDRQRKKAMASSQRPPKKK